MARKQGATAEAPAEKGPLYHVVRKDYFGDPGKRVGSNLSKTRAEQYAEEMRAAEERAAFEIVPAKD